MSLAQGKIDYKSENFAKNKLIESLLWKFFDLSFLSHSMSADPQWAISDWVSQDDEESVLEAILQQSAQEFYSSKE